MPLPLASSLEGYVGAVLWRDIGRSPAFARCLPFAPYCVTLSFRTPHCLFLVALVLPASFCSIHSSGQHNMATLILSVCAELVGLPSFSPPLDQKVSRTLAQTVNFAACSLPSVKTKTRNPLRSSLQAGGILWRMRRGFAYCRSDSATE